MKIKKLLLMISPLVVACVVWAVFPAFANDGFSAWHNPIWQHLYKDQPLSLYSAPEAYTSPVLCTSYESFKTALKQRFEDRAETFVIDLAYSFNFGDVGTIIDNACTEVLASDDYLKGNFYSRYASWSGYDGTVSISFTIAYMTTYAQEQQITARVAEIIPGIISGGMNAEEKIRAIHDWIVLNVEYDQSLQNYTAYGALFGDKEAVCQGYTLLAIRLLKDVQIVSKLVSGYGFSFGGWGSHAWNLTYVCGSWYHMDVTWDDPITSPADPHFIRWDYYLKSDNTMLADHSWEPSNYPPAPQDFDGCNDFDDSDGDGVVDSSDNCPGTYNPDQLDANGNGIGDACESGYDAILLYNPTAGRFYLKNELTGGAADITFQFGPRNSPWKPTAGDWNGNGQTTVGLFNPVSAKFFMKNSHSGGDADIAFSFGPRNRNWIPISGDWNGDGQCDFGLYDPTKSRFFLKTSLSGGQADYTFQLGPKNAGWLPIAGDWDGDGLDSIGLYSPQAGKFHLNNTLSGGAADVSIRYGAKRSSWLPVCGDWDGDGSDEIGLYNPAPSKFFLKNDLTGGEADMIFSFGPSGGGWLPGSGIWQ